MVALELSDKYGKFAIEPLERGFGQTLGSAFRRVLLAHIEGATVTDVRIDGVPHAFTTIEGLYEDATELCLNIKELAIKYSPEIAGEGEQICRIDTHGKGEITGADVICPPGIEIDNPEVHIAEITEASGSLVIDLWVSLLQAIARWSSRAAKSAGMTSSRWMRCTRRSRAARTRWSRPVWATGRTWTGY